MDAAPHIILVTHPRSGSNSLVEILDLHSDLRILNEPFNENFASWDKANPNYRDRVHDTDSLDEVLAEVFATYSGIKTLGYQLPGTLLEHLLLRPDVHVVFLRRRNLLEAVVSNLIAMQTNLWKTWDADRPLEDYYTHLQALDVYEVKHLMTGTDAVLTQINEIVDRRRDGRVLKICYEDLYLADRDEQHSSLDALWSFLGVNPCADPAIDYYLDPANVQMRSARTYGTLPNLRELNTALGNDTTGWLDYE